MSTQMARSGTAFPMLLKLHHEIKNLDHEEHLQAPLAVLREGFRTLHPRELIGSFGSTARYS